MADSILNSVSLGALGAALLIASPAFAQTSSPTPAGPPVDAQETPPADPAATPPSAPEVTVTGSRIRRADYTATSPIVTIGSERLSQTPAVTVEKTLNQLPQFSPSVGASDTFPPRGAQSQLNLRGLGTNRSLILFDGRRIQPANPDGTVDVNFIPTNVIANIETITGGASATYGSDAMSGVVNFIPFKSFSGIQLEGQAGVTSQGDGGTYNLSGLAGTSFGEDRGSAILSLSYAHRDEVFHRNREFFRLSVPNARLPYATSLLSANPPSQAAVNTVFARYGVAAGAAARTAPFGINADGTLFASSGSAPVANYRGPLDDNYVIQNNAVLYNSGQAYDLQIPFNRFNVFGKVGYKLADNVELYSQLFYTHYSAVISSVPISFGTGGRNGSLPATNPFIPADLRTLLASRATPNAAFPFTYSFVQLGAQHNRYVYDIGQVQLGLKGNFGNWTWDVYGSTGKTKVANQLTGTVSGVAAQQLLDAPDGGRSLCTGGFNPFASDPFSLSQSCIEYIRRNPTSKSDFAQTVVEGTAQGRLFNLPAGPLRMAVGASYRRDSFSQRPDALFQSGELLGSVSISLPASGHQSVKEGFVEALIPIIHDTPLIRALNLDLAYRYSDYTSVGGVSTYKGDLEWEVTPWIRLRGGYSRAIRAPSLGELYNPSSTTSVTLGTPSATTTAGDPCDIRSSYRLGADGAKVRALCLAQGVPPAAIDSYTFTSLAVFGLVQGNPNVSQETADTYSVGAVLRSPLTHGPLSSFQLSVDYYDIAIKNAIGSLPFATGLARCFNGNGANPTFDQSNIYCSVIERNSVGSISVARIATLNLSRYATRGVDVQADWRIGLETLGLGADAGSINLNFVGTRLLNFKVVDLIGSASVDYAGYSSSPLNTAVLPKNKFTVTASYAGPLFTLGGRLRYIGPTTHSSALLGPTTQANIAAYHYVDLFGTIRVGQGYELRMGVNNLSDKGPPITNSTSGTTDERTYDILGRSFFVGAKVRF